MRVTLEIEGSQTASILEVLKNIKGVTITSVDEHDSAYLNELKNAYNETQLDKEGKISLKSFNELLDDV
jgi:hypothetical protein